MPINRNENEKFCSHCGKTISNKAEICPQCGVRQFNPYLYGQQNSAQSFHNENGYDWLTTLMLCIFLGWLGVHRFYTKSTGYGIVMLLTFGLFGFGVLIDFILILTGSFKDGKNNPLVRRN